MASNISRFSHGPLLPPNHTPWNSIWFENSPHWVLATGLIVILLACCLESVRHRSGHDGKIPPGPSGVPVVGCHPFLNRYPELVLDRWSKRFGPIYSMWLGSQLFVVVSDPAIAKDLLVNNGLTFSSRKEMFIKSQTVFAGRGITATPYNETWLRRKHRQVAHEWLNQSAVDKYSAILEFEAAVMIKSLLDESGGGSMPLNPQRHAGRLSLNTMLSVTFGVRTCCLNHPMIDKALLISRAFMNCTGPVSNVVDFLPILQHLPGPLRCRARALHQRLVDTYGGLIKQINLKVREGVPFRDCLAKTMLMDKSGDHMDHLDMTMLASAFLIGGVETTAAIIQWFLALIPTHPQIQREAQLELDRVVGSDRMPTIGDEQNLPYCRALIKEIERCHNPFWLGTPHFSTDDFFYGEHYIPKDTVIVLNTWTMHHAPDRYSSPDVFDPSRYLSDGLSASESSRLADPYSRDHWMYGAGRRICPGMILAEREIFLGVTRLLWAFTMEALPDEPIDLKEYDGLSGRSPVPFRIRLVPRHQNVRGVVNDHVASTPSGVPDMPASMVF